MCEIAGLFDVSLDTAPFDLAILGVFGMMQDSLPQERQLGATIHASFNELQTVHMDAREAHYSTEALTPRRQQLCLVGSW